MLAGLKFRKAIFRGRVRLTIVHNYKVEVQIKIRIIIRSSFRLDNQSGVRDCKVEVEVEVQIEVDIVRAQINIMAIIWKKTKVMIAMF